jgi:hypothetical protein
MKETGFRVQFCIATALLVLFVPRFAKGDGGIIRLREVQGPFSITVFSSPEAASGGLTDVSALIQERESGKVILDADVRLAVIPPDGAALNQSDKFCAAPATGTRQGLNSPASVRATREQASNKLLYSAPVELNVPGNWKLHVIVSRGTDTARFDCLLPVALSSGKLIGLLPYLLLPPLVVAAFALNQWLRRQSLQSR